MATMPHVVERRPAAVQLLLLRRSETQDALVGEGEASGAAASLRFLPMPLDLYL